MGQARRVEVRHGQIFTRCRGATLYRVCIFWAQRSLDIYTVGSHKSIAIIERFWRTLKDECCRRIVVPLGLVEMQSELDVYMAWYNQHRPHRALGGATPAERRAEKVAEVVRPETRARVPIRGDPKRTKRVSSLELGVDGYEGRTHLPVVTLRAA